MNNPGEILKNVRTAKGFTQEALAKAVNTNLRTIQRYEQGDFPKFKNDTIKQIDSILGTELYDNLFRDDMKIVRAPQGKFPKKTKPGELIDFYDTDFAAGEIEFYDDNNVIAPAYTMDIPDFAGCTAFRTYGTSMEKLIKSGSILFGTKVEDWQSHLEYGQIYGIICTDKRKYLKYIRKGSDDTHFLLKSENKEMYDDFPMPKSKIKSIWLIHGWINKRT